MNFDEAMEFLKETERYGWQPGLARVRTMMTELGNPQDEIPIVHIAGTNGKGSVGTMMRTVLSESGYRVGHFSSPSVFSFEEMYTISDVCLKREDPGNGFSLRERLAEVFTQVFAACKKIGGRGEAHPTRFEIETAAAFLLFFEEDCDIALIEAGMGGWKDATNIVSKPLLSVITSISLDHTAFLGDNLREIACAKAGIIKDGVPLITAVQDEKVYAALKERCKDTDSEMIIAMPAKMSPAAKMSSAAGHTAHERSMIQSKYDWRSSDESTSLHQFALGCAGTFQADNASCALEALSQLCDRYPGICEESVRAGLRSARCPGRFERVNMKDEHGMGFFDSADIDVYLDGAHNPGAAARLRESIDTFLPGKAIIFILGMYADKDIPAFINALYKKGDCVYTVPTEGIRGQSADALSGILWGCGVGSRPQPNMTAALCAAAKDLEAAEETAMDETAAVISSAAKDAEAAEQTGMDGTAVVICGSFSILRDSKMRILFF